MKDLGLSGIIPVPAGCLPAWQRPAPGSSAVIVSILGDSRVIFTIRNTFYKVSVDDSPPLVLGERPAGRGQHQNGWTAFEVWQAAMTAARRRTGPGHDSAPGASAREDVPCGPPSHVPVHGGYLRPSCLLPNGELRLRLIMSRSGCVRSRHWILRRRHGRGRCRSGPARAPPARSPRRCGRTAARSRPATGRASPAITAIEAGPTCRMRSRP